MSFSSASRVCAVRHLCPALMLVALVLLLGVPMVWAGTGVWTRADDPEGGYIYDIAVSHQNPNKVYAATPRGIYRSDDGGGSWSLLSNSILDSRQVVVDPDNDNYLYAFIRGGDNLHRSTDGGNTWTELEIISGEDRDVNTITLTGGTSSARTLYIGVGGYRIFKSTDSGASWTELAPLPNSSTINDILVDGTTIYVALWEYGVYRSDDGGSTWALKDNGLGSLAVTCLALDTSTSSSLLLVGTHEREGGGWIYRSSDRGDSWTQAGAPGWNYVEEIIILPDSPRTVYAQYHGGLRVSTDVGSGDTWEDRTNGLEGWFGTGSTLTLAPSNPNTMYIGGSHGVFWTDDAGEQWIPRYTGMHARPAAWRSIAYDPINPSVAYAAVWAYPLLVIYDGGESWEYLSTYPHQDVRYVATHPTDPSIIYTTQHHAVVRSTDGGNTWTDLNNEGTIFGGNNDDEGCWAIAIDPQNPDVLYASTDRGGNLVYKSTDGGDTWEAKNSGLPPPPGEGDAERRIRQIVIDPQTSAVYVIFERQYSVYRSTDGGDNWTPVNTGVSQTGWQNLTIDPSTTPSTLYLAAAWDNDRGLYISRDDGATWQKIRGDDAVNVAVDPLDPDHLFMAYSGRIEESKDGGATWTDFSEGLYTLHPMKVSINPHNRYILIAGTEGGLYHYAFPHVQIKTAREIATPEGIAVVYIKVPDDLTGMDVMSGDFTLTYNSEQLTYVDGYQGDDIHPHDPGGLDSPEMEFFIHSPEPGEVRLSFTSSDPLEGRGVLAALRFKVSPEVEWEQEYPMVLEGEFNEGEPGTVCLSRIVKIRPAGDVTRNGRTSSYDASYILRHVVGRINLIDDPDLFDGNRSDALRRADMTRDRTISALDASQILRYIVGILPGLPWPVDIEVPGAKAMATGPRLATLKPTKGGVVLSLDDASGIAAGEVMMRYDPSSIQIKDVSAIGPLADWMIEHYAQNGEIKVAFAGAYPAKGEGAILRVEVESPSENVAEAFSLERISLNEGHIPVEIQAREFVSSQPLVYRLSQNHPNPFNPQTTLSYDVAKTGAMRLTVYTLTGQRIRTLVDEERVAGTYAATWDGTDDAGRDVASGVYLCRMEVGTFEAVRKLVLVR